MKMFNANKQKWSIWLLQKYFFWNAVMCTGLICSTLFTNVKNIFTGHLTQGQRNKLYQKHLLWRVALKSTNSKFLGNFPGKWSYLFHSPKRMKRLRTKLFAVLSPFVKPARPRWRQTHLSRHMYCTAKNYTYF